jgi:hypothetical protein
LCFRQLALELHNLLGMPFILHNMLVLEFVGLLLA